jgi:hypothetical protein
MRIGLWMKGLVTGMIIIFILGSFSPGTSEKISDIPTEKETLHYETIKQQVIRSYDWLHEQWNNTFGGAYQDICYAARQTQDDGYILIGQTRIIEGEYLDVLLVKTDGNGNEQWKKTFGGEQTDYGCAVEQTSDGGYLLVGNTLSYGPVNMNVWLIKTDTSGNELWNKTLSFGEHTSDEAFSMQRTADNGYIILGVTMEGNDWDIWVIKINQAGIIQWEKTFDRTTEDYGYSVQQTNDNGFIIVGCSRTAEPFDKDLWLIKTDANGNQQWNRIFGKSGYESGYSVKQTQDGGYIIAGETSSYGTDEADLWLIKTNTIGYEEWNKTFGGTGNDRGRSVLQDTDSGYIICGYTYSFGAGESDLWFIKTDTNGIEQSNKTFGGTYWEYGECVQKTKDKGFILAGSTTSYGNGEEDYWLIKIEREYRPPNPPIITGPTQGKIKVDTDYNFTATDPDNDDLYYFIDWGDHTNTSWIGPYPSGELTIKSHTWSTKGTYTIKAKVKDIYGNESSWGQLSVTMPCSYNSLDPGWIQGPIWGRIDGYEFLGTENHATLLFHAKNVHYFGIGHAFNAGLYPRHWVNEEVSAYYSYFKGIITEHIIIGKISGLPNQ